MIEISVFWEGLIAGVIIGIFIGYFALGLIRVFIDFAFRERS